MQPCLSQKKKEKYLVEQHRFVNGRKSIFRVYWCVSSRGCCTGLSPLLFRHRHRRLYAAMPSCRWPPLPLVWLALPEFGTKPNLGSFQKTSTLFIVVLPKLFTSFFVVQPDYVVHQHSNRCTMAVYSSLPQKHVHKKHARK